MVRLQRGETSALAAVFDRHGRLAYSLAHRICGRGAMAEEVVQDAFLALWHHRARFDGSRGSVRAWLMTLVRNRAVDAVRREHVRSSRDTANEGAAEALPSPDSVAEEAERREQARTLHGALSALPPDQREVIELAYFAGLTHTQIATRLGIPAGTVKGRMRLGLEKLHAAIAPAGSPPRGVRTSA
jgi:RNA polymerase sigma-70 factor, ECF subfamily